nr:response regulator [Blautia sp. MSJ-19]
MLNGKKVLLVDDNELNREIAEFMLIDMGISVVQARNGKEAVELFEETDSYTFDFILMDIMMPVMNGLDAAREIRNMKREDAKTIPIIALSANAYIEDIQSSINAGMNEHLTKPVEIEMLRNTLEKFC